LKIQDILLPLKSFTDAKLEMGVQKKLQELFVKEIIEGRK
jgi:hypothetical protein